MNTTEGPLPTFTLTTNEAAYCETVGHMRYVANLGRPNAYGLAKDGRDEEVLGAYGEYCVSLWLDRSWRPVVDNPWTDLDGDVGPLQVRTTRNARDPHLICHPRDKDQATFILVSRLEWNQFRIEGWLPGSLAKDQTYWGDKYKHNRPAFFVPPAQLYHPEQMKKP
jgi:hypothetical protein